MVHRGQDKGGQEASDGVVCCTKQVSVYEMRKRQQVSEDAREMCRTTLVDEGHKTQVQKMDEGFMAEARASTVQQEREREREREREVYAALQYAASFHCLVEDWRNCEELKPKPKEKWTFVDKKSEARKHRTEWCALANK